MDRRTPPTGQRRNTYRSSQAPRRNVRPAGSMPDPRVYETLPPRRPNGGSRRVGQQGSYHRYARRKRRGRMLQKLAWLLAALLLAGAAFLVLNGTQLLDLLEIGSDQPQTQPVAAPVEEQDNRFVIAVDPGHGGGDPGSTGVSFDEEEMTWDTADRLLKLLEADDRFSAFLTTDGSEYEKPSQRAANARAGGAQLLISIHGNSGDDPSYVGFECYPVPPGRTYNAESLAFGQMIAKRFGEAGERLRGEGGVRYIYYEDNNEKHVYEVSDTTIHTDTTFTLLEECGCPAVLAEQCFITSPEDVDAFGDEDGRQAAAQIYYDAICEWYDSYGPDAAGTDSSTADSLT